MLEGAERLRTALHETDHAVANLEGFSPGATPKQYMPAAMASARQFVKPSEMVRNKSGVEALPSVWENRARKASEQAYLDTAGEQQARAVERRRLMAEKFGDDYLKNNSPYAEQIPANEQVHNPLWLFTQPLPVRDAILRRSSNLGDFFNSYYSNLVRR
jgi:hypothetical protein